MGDEAAGPWALAELTLNVVGPLSGVTATDRFFQVTRYGGGLVVEMRSYGDAGEARREYERLSGERA
jgi:hypothetical protein